VGITSIIVVLLIGVLWLRRRGRRARWRSALTSAVPVAAGAITPDATSVLQQRGWQRKGGSYYGPFATPYGTWHGQLEPAGGRFRCYIKNPPMHALAGHPKRPCFSNFSGDWWSINLAVSPVDSDPAAIILHIERLITNAFRGAAR
jgi:hypothetical protein